MLHEFLQAHRDELIARCRAKASKRNQAPLAPGHYGIAKFIDQLIEVFRREQTPENLAGRKSAENRRPSLTLVPSEIPGIAARHGVELHEQGVTIEQVVHDYGDLCQALTELALEKGEPISVDEFHTFNRCSDDAIAIAVSNFARVHPEPLPGEDIAATNPRIESPGARMRILVDVAIQSFAAIKSGQVAIHGATAKVHEDALLEMRDLVSQAFGDSSRDAGAQTRG